MAKSSRGRCGHECARRRREGWAADRGRLPDGRVRGGPVAILDGMSCLSAPEGDELNTLRRLGLGKSTRMACCARIKSGTVTVSMTPEPGDGSGAKPTRYDRSIVSVVVLGNGIAGVTAADFIRRGHPDCEIHIVGRESHALYNRMGISRLVYGRSAMQGLYLLPEQWYDEHGVNAWLNTVATRIDLRWRRVHLSTGEVPSLRPADPRDGLERCRPPHRGAKQAGLFRAERGGRRDADPCLRPAARLPSGCGGRWRAARPRGRLLAAPAWTECDCARTAKPAAEPPDRPTLFGVGRGALRKGGHRDPAEGRNLAHHRDPCGYRGRAQGRPHRASAKCSSRQQASARTSSWRATLGFRSTKVSS